MIVYNGIITTKKYLWWESQWSSRAQSSGNFLSWFPMTRSPRAFSGSLKYRWNDHECVWMNMYAMCVDIYIYIHINICAQSLCDCVRNHSMFLSYPKILPKIGWWSICIGRTNPAEPFPAGGRLKLPKQKGWVLKIIYIQSVG